MSRHSTSTPVTGHSGLSGPWGQSRQPVPSQLLLSLWVLGTGYRAVERRGRSGGEGERQDSTGFMPSVQTLCSASVWRRPFTRESRHPPENGDKGTHVAGLDCCKAGMLSTAAASSKLRRAFCQSAGFDSSPPPE